MHNKEEHEGILWEFHLDGYKAYLSPAIDCFDGWPVCWRVSRHPDADPKCGMLEDC